MMQLRASLCPILSLSFWTTKILYLASNCLSPSMVRSTPLLLNCHVSLSCFLTQNRRHQMCADSPVIHAFGWGATLLGFVTSSSAIQEGIPIYKNKKTGPLDPNPFIAQFVNQVTWGAYGVLTRSVPMYFNYSFGLLCCVLFFFAFGRGCTPEQFPSYRNRLLLAGALAACSVAVALTLPREFLGWIGSVASVLVYFLPFSRIYKTRSTACVSVMLNAAGGLSNVCWTVYGVARNDKLLGYSSAVCMVLTGIILSMRAFEYFYLRRSGKDGMADKLSPQGKTTSPSTAVPVSPAGLGPGQEEMARLAAGQSPSATPTASPTTAIVMPLPTHDPSEAAPSAK